MKKHEKNSYLGFIIGDCLGVPFEFRKRGTFSCDKQMSGGWHNQPAGTWSDDTSLLLATIDAIKKGVSEKKLYDNFNDFLAKGKYTKNGLFDIGESTRKAIIKRKGGKEIKDNGNGALMRILPFAFGDFTDEEIIKYGGLTHNHYISHWSCLFYVHFVRELVKGDKFKAYKIACEYMQRHDDNGEFAIITSGEIDKIEIDDIKSGGYVVDTLEAVLWCFLNNDSYNRVVYSAINLGGDTDTIGALCGGVAGILYRVPKHNINLTNIINNSQNK